jgi:nitrite reductase (NADH) small subunit
MPQSNEAKEFKCGEKEICIANVDGTFSAMDNICLHRGGPLGQGMIANGKLICPWHAWAWDPLKIENGDVMIEIDAGASVRS